MHLKIPELNLVLAWGGILLGFLSGLWLGVNFHRPDWLGGYASHQRRLYRLGHISLFGLGATNLLFYFTALKLPVASVVVSTAACGFIVGAITMPLCCVLMAHYPNLRHLFAVPVISLILAGTLTLWEVIKL